MLTLFVAACSCWLAVVHAEMETAIVPSIQCGSRLALDEAQIHFTSTEANIVLYATNRGCWECTETLVTASQDDTTCSGLWAPHGWNLYFRNTQSNQLLLAEKQFAFGEHGQYEVQFSMIVDAVSGAQAPNVQIVEVVAPIDSMAPFVALLIVIVAVVVVAFGAPYLVSFLLKFERVQEMRSALEIWWQSWSVVSLLNTSSNNNSSSYGGPLSEVSVRDSEHDLRAGTMPLLSSAGAHNPGPGVIAVGIDSDVYNPNPNGTSNSNNCYSNSSRQSWSNLLTTSATGVGTGVVGKVYQHEDKDEDTFDMEAGGGQSTPTTTLRSSFGQQPQQDTRHIRRTNSGVSTASGASNSSGTGRFSDVDNTTKSPFGGRDRDRDREISHSSSPRLPSPQPQQTIIITSSTRSTVTAENASGVSPRSERLVSLDSFRGIALSVMTFANYGAGGYWFLDHAAWNGLTVADMVFPWFMFMMGVSMALSYASIFKKAEREGVDLASTRRLLYYKAARRTLILFVLGMFMANGFHYSHWRIPGVLQYFAFSYGVTSFTVLLLMPQTREALSAIVEKERQDVERSRSWRVHPEDRPWLMRLFGDSETGVMPSMVMLGYRYEWAVQFVLILLYLSISLGAQAPGCPRGYQGPGGIGNDAQYPDCTGGIHRWIDVQLFGMDHIYLNPTCKLLYNCVGYDPEGTLGSLTACTLTYLGLMTGRVLVHFKSHSERLKRWGIWSFVLLFLCGCLCGFSQNDGLVPINKNLWSTSFGFITAGTGIIGLALCYILMDIYAMWTGAPFNYLGMNSILFYMGQAFFHRYFPFSYSTNSTSHARLLQMHVIGTCAWFLVAYWCWKKKFFVKI